ncbi:hypothetical protein ACIP9H_07380 [Streptomyces sp. NPDC088732]|uniref:hypothetical protein n=1 Tax=Streptomyces sp. NPDC088732 TaxID=3365879 RepID=UPI0038019FD5
MDHAREITTLAPAPGRTAADFVAGNQDGTVVDIVARDTPEQAMAAARGITTETGGSPVHATIGRRTVDRQVARMADTA